MSDARVTDGLATKVLGWRLSPAKYLKPGRSWIPKSRFQPLKNDRDAGRLLDALSAPYSLLVTRGHGITVEYLGTKQNLAMRQMTESSWQYEIRLAVQAHLDNVM